ncbi:SCO family protein [Aliidiomarina iranensis]|uniref:SCO family protein n=1 Tax=Aliidiomarina iranensis TaxID=1434071 RepID=A0A432W2E9_9GAMM|nr:SCO family protein [Aliidiomarina iranensis]RUO23389.1 SCO family protein [Aliidiomarina iranensis]
MKKVLAALVMIAVAAVGAFSYLQITSNNPPELESARIYDQARPISPFVLEGTGGSDVENQALLGQWTLMFTGYTYCPDICPTTMAQLKSRWADIDGATDLPVQVWMISVDPKRDDIERVGMYIDFFGEGFFGVRAEHKELYPFVRDIGLMYSLPDEGETDYLVNHSSAIILVDPNGEQQAIFRPSHELGALATVNPNQLVNDFQKIARYLERANSY